MFEVVTCNFSPLHSSTNLAGKCTFNSVTQLKGLMDVHPLDAPQQRAYRGLLNAEREGG